MELLTEKIFSQWSFGSFFVLFYKNAKMYNQGRTISRETKLNDRGWTNIEFLKEEQLINLDRFKKLDKMLCESFVDL